MLVRPNDLRWWRWAFCLFAPLSLSSMAGMSLGGGIFTLASVWAIGRAWRGGGKEWIKEICGEPILWFTALLFVVSFASLLWAQVNPPLGEAISGFRELKKFHHFLYPVWVASALLFTSDAMEKHPFWKLWGGMGIICGVLALAQFFGRDLFPAAWLESRFFRPVGETGRFHGQGLMFFHLSFAACMSFVAAAGLARCLWPLRFDGKKERFFWAAVAIAGGLATFFSYSRIALVGLVVMWAFLFFLRKPWLGMIGLIFLLGAAAVVWQFSPSLQERFGQTAGTNKERVLMWKSAWEMFQDRPALGFGFGRSGKYTPVYAEKILGSKPWFTSHAHNNFLDALASTGLLGLLAYLGWWGALFVAAWRSFRASGPAEKWLPAAALAAFVAFQINGLTQVNFGDGKSQHTLMIWVGVALALSIRRRREE